MYVKGLGVPLIFVNRRYSKGVHFLKNGIQLFRERSRSGKVHATILKGIMGGLEFSFFQRNLKELARKAMEMCLWVLKESNKSSFDSYSRQEQCIDYIPYCLLGLSRAHFFSDNLSRNSHGWTNLKKIKTDCNSG